MSDRKEYIERGALEEKLNRRLEQLRKEYGNYDHYTDGFDEAVDIVEDEPAAADVVEVVRCADCCAHGSCLTEDTFKIARIKDPYCCAGKRKDGADSE